MRSWPVFGVFGICRLLVIRQQLYFLQLSACLCKGREPGCAPGGAVTFFRFAERKSPKKGRPYSLRPFASLRATCGARSRGAPWNSLCAFGAPLEQPRRVRSRSGCVLRHTRHPAPCAPRRIQKGQGKSKQPHGPSLCSAWPAQREALAPANAGASAAMARVDCGLQTPFWLRLRRGVCGVSMRAPARMLRELTRRVCSNGARQRAVSYAAHPASAPTQVCPFAARRGRRLWGAFLCLLSCRATRKEVARRGETRPPPSTAPPGASKRKIHAPQSQLK